MRKLLKIAIFAFEKSHAERQKLPDIPPNHPTYHIITKNEPNYELIISDEAQKIIDSEHEAANKIIVPNRRGTSHFLLKKTELSLRLIHYRSNILVSNEQEGIFKLTVSKGELNRALRILNVLIKELEKRKFMVYVDNGLIKVRIFGVDIGFSLKEKLRRIELPQKSESYYKEYDNLPTGKLLLSLENIRVEHKIRKNFIDNFSGKIEDKLNEFIIALVICSQALIAEAKYCEEQNKIWKEKERKRQELLEQIKNEERKIIELNKNIELFHKAKIIREYIEDFRQKKLDNSINDEKRKELEEYIKWGLEQADRLDPLVESPPSVLDMKDKVSYFGWSTDI